MNKYKPGTKVRIVEWDGLTGVGGDPTGKVGYIGACGWAV